MDKFTDYIGYIVGIFGIGTGFLLNSRKTNNDEFKSTIETYKLLLEEYKSQIEDYKKQEAECLEKYKKLEAEIQVMKISFQLNQHAIPAVPFPLWWKSLDGIMLDLNEHYESEFLKKLNKNRNDYIGKKDSEVWGKTTGDLFQKTDKETLLSGEIIPVNDVSEKHKDILNPWRFFKLTIHIGKVPVGIMGFALRKEWLEKNEYKS